MKPKRQIATLRVADDKSKDLVDPLTLIRWIAESYQREQELLRQRRFVGGPSDSALDLTATSTSIGTFSTVNSATFRNGQKTQQAARNADGTIKTVKQPYQLPLAERRKGGVMTDHSTTVNGLRVLASGGPSGSVSSVQSLPAFNVTLDLVSSVPGNHKTPNPHRYRKRYYNYGSGSVVTTDSAGNFSSVSGTQGYSTAFVDAFNNQGNAAYNRALSKMYEGIRGSVDLSVDAFQARQAGLMLNTRFSQARFLFTRAAPRALIMMGGLVSNLRRVNPKQWGSMWLEWQYGWRPLAGSIYGAMENMIVASKQGQTSGHPISVQTSEIGDDRVTSESLGNGTRSRIYKSKYGTRIVAFYALTNGGLNSVANYTSLNPASIAWELVPYSFVADWFVDVGGYLRNMESSLLYGSDFVGGYRSSISLENYDEVVQGGGSLGGGSFTSYEGQGNVQTRRFDRTVFGSSPMPHSPSFNPRLGTSRLISAASLLSQQLHSLKKRIV